MNYIVFDLEWTQNPDGKSHPDSPLTFEIIEIGAVKCDENRIPVDTFHRLIRPRLYKWIPDSVQKVIHMTYKDLREGVRFEDAARDFLSWCGEDFIFCTWASQDITELQKNLNYYGLLSALNGPIAYLDVQKIYCMMSPDHDLQKRVSLETAVTELSLTSESDFHRALEDAMYTAKVFSTLDSDLFEENYSLDVYQNPKKKKDEIRLFTHTSEQYVTREFADRDRILLDPQVMAVPCPVCHRLARKKIRWLMINPKTWISLSSCREHGLISGKVRIQKSSSGRCFAVRKLSLAGPEEAASITERYNLLKKKKAAVRRAQAPYVI